MSTPTDNLVEAINAADAKAIARALAAGEDPDLPRKGLLAFSFGDAVFSARQISPINAAIASHPQSIVQALIQGGAQVNHGDPHPPVMVALQHGKLDALKALHEAGACLSEAHLGEGGGTLLHMAAKGGHADICEWLVECGLDIEARDGSRQTPLSICLDQGAIDAKHKHAALALLRMGAQPNCNSKGTPGYGFNNPMGQAIAQGDGDLVRALAGAGGRLDEALAWAGTLEVPPCPIALALRREDGAFEVVQTLIDLGARLDTLGHVYFAAGGYYEVANRPSVVREGDDVVGLLALACMEGRLDEAKTLIDAGMDPNATSKHGRNCLMVMLERACHAPLPQQKKMVRLLLESGVQVDAAGPGGNTALHLLGRRYNRVPRNEASTIKMMEALLEAGADPWIANNDGLTPMESMLTAAPETSPGVKLLKAHMEHHALDRSVPGNKQCGRKRRL